MPNESIVESPEEILLPKPEGYKKFVESFRKYAHLVPTEEGNYVWDGDRRWPLFIGYPFIRSEKKTIQTFHGEETSFEYHLVETGYNLIILYHSPVNQCFVCVDADIYVKQ